MTRSDTEDEHIPREGAIPGLLSEADLVERLRSRTEAERPAVRELQRRHLPVVAGYAQLFTVSAPSGRQLADEAFFRAVEEVCEGVDPSGTWRHHALTHVGEAALDWAADERREWLRPDFLAWVHTADVSRGSKSPNAMISAFYQLPERLRSALWYAVVDDEPYSEVATHLGTTSGAVPDLAAKAQVAMRDAYAQEHLSRRGTAECRGFKRIIEAAAQARGGDRHPDLAAHLTRCVDCGVLLSGLTGLSGSPRTLLAEGLLMWGGGAYTERVPTRGTPETKPLEQGTEPGAGGRESRLDVHAALGEVSNGPGRPGPAHRSVPGHRTVKAAGGMAAMVAVAAVAAVASHDVLPESWNVSGLVRPQPSRPADPSPSSTPSRSADGTPSGGPNTDPGREAPAPVPVGTPSQIVHASTGLCLDVENQVVDKRVSAVAAPCGSGATQRWTFDTDGHLHNEADSDFCLKVGGDSAVVGIRPCTSDDPDKRSRMTFVISENGAIHSKPQSDQVIVPVATSSDEVRQLVLKESSGVGDERWGTRPVGATGASPLPAASAS
ncbi:ricin-type beta-trefoil lectin domain protein [Streptomyces sp. WMMC940]|uniref:ricin-type beta-trefoil lectin domain protein n=1 Tax=Streptomyces sp. WMMC940 TaxID=3015153 RepID=UPI0022B734CC|nr:ricin-type beta-trefoil lectin domain protein [Streptomyces sp. WMMC940]MCZ7456437.1 ricin-type beta-trefoil lectin domain protein [Streptomyces sp. WMMC940]